MSRKGVSEHHTTIINELCKACDSESFTNLKTLAKTKGFGGLRAGELEKLTDIRELLDKLERKRVFKEGQYEDLKRLFEKAEFSDGIEIIEEEAMDQGDHQTSHVNNSNVGLTSHPPTLQHAAAHSSFGSTTRSHHIRDQDDASPIIPALPVYEKGRGYVLFINNFVKNGGTRNMKRLGASIDEDNIKMVFQDFIKSFTLNIQRDLSKRSLSQLLDNVAGEIERNEYKSLICIISSHGERHSVEAAGRQAFKEGFLTVDEQLVTEDEITEKFEGHKLPRLKGCPKVFIFQCCRGTAPGRGVMDRADSTEVEPTSYSAAAPMDMSDGPKPVNLPTNADMLIVHSTSKGTKAWRNERDGSWFINSFCDILKKCHNSDHLLDILLRVNGDVAEKESSEGGAKQMPCQVSTFTKKFMLS